MRDDFKHPQSINPLKLHIPYFDTIAFDNDFIVEFSETSDNPPYITTSTSESIQHLITLTLKLMIQLNFFPIHLNHQLNTHNKVHKQHNR